MKYKKFKTNLGVSLVLLIISVIVLIILAGVSISLVLGENGIMSKAREGRNNYQVAANEEAVGLASLEAEMEQKIGGTGTVEGYGLRADGKFYCDPSSTVGKAYGDSRTQTGLVYESSNFYCEGDDDDEFWLYDDPDTGEGVYGTKYYVWDRDGSWDDGDYYDVFDSSGVFLCNACNEST